MLMTSLRLGELAQVVESHFGSCNFSFLKNSKSANLFQIEREKPYVWLLINNINMKKFAWRKCRKILLEAIFSHSTKLFSKFPHKIFLTILRDIIGLDQLFTCDKSVMKYPQKLILLRLVKYFDKIVNMEPVRELNLGSENLATIPTGQTWLNIDLIKVSTYFSLLNWYYITPVICWLIG